jgi:GrpB-like predicted nucleotidyltransferase (UPF0157 family)
LSDADGYANLPVALSKGAKTQMAVSFLEMLKARMDDAQKRYAEVQQRLQAVQGEHQRAAQELASWQTAFQTETRNEAARAATLALTQNAGQPPVITALAAAAVTVTEHASEGSPDTNKTELVRDVLKRSNGIRPIDVWKTVQEQIPNRTYVYSVLKRLKDKDQVSVRKGKYYFRMVPKIEENKDVVLH